MNGISDSHDAIAGGSSGFDTSINFNPHDGDAPAASTSKVRLEEMMETADDHALLGSAGDGPIEAVDEEATARAEQQFPESLQEYYWDCLYCSSKPSKVSGAEHFSRSVRSSADLAVGIPLQHARFVSCAVQFLFLRGFLYPSHNRIKLLSASCRRSRSITTRPQRFTRMVHKRFIKAIAILCPHCCLLNLGSWMRNSTWTYLLS